MKPKKVGRPSNAELSKTGPKNNWKLTTEVIGKLEAAFAIDCSTVEACAFADINADTYYRWIKENPELSDRFQRLKHNPILRAKDSVFKGLKGNPELALKYLKAKKPKEFIESLQVESKSLQYHIVKIVNELNNGNKSSGDRIISGQDVPDDPSVQDQGQKT